MALGVTKQSNIAVNKARNLVFFEGTELVYNYKTQQWSRIPAYDGYGVYSYNAKTVSFGLVVYSSGSVDLQVQAETNGVQTATITTAAPNLNQGGRAVVTGVRPIHNGGTASVRVGVQDDPNDAVSYSTATSVNSRSGMANFREEGRYHRAELTVTGGFDVINSADIEFSSQGRV